MLISIVIHNWDELTIKNQELSKLVLSHALEYYDLSGLVFELTKQTRRFELVSSLATKKWHHNRLNKDRNESASNDK
jgi:hypothetical protein